MLYRLVHALAAIGILTEHDSAKAAPHSRTSADDRHTITLNGPMRST
jgi:hypothetical protein